MSSRPFFHAIDDHGAGDIQLLRRVRVQLVPAAGNGLQPGLRQQRRQGLRRAHVRAVAPAADDERRAGELAQPRREVQPPHGGGEGDNVPLGKAHAAEGPPRHQAEHGRLHAQQQPRHPVLRRDERERAHALRPVEGIVQRQHGPQRKAAERQRPFQGVKFPRERTVEPVVYHAPPAREPRQVRHERLPAGGEAGQHSRPALRPLSQAVDENLRHITAP